MRKYLNWIIIGVIVIAGLFIYPYYTSVFAPNVTITNGKEADFFIPTGSDYVAVGEKLLQEKLLQNPKAFHWVAQRMNYPNHVYPGRYVLQDGMSTRELVQLLRSGKQTPIDFTFIKFRTKEDFAKYAASQLEFPTKHLLDVMNDEEFLGEMGLTPQTVIGVLIPNTYNLYWNTSPTSFIKRMYEEYRNFWNQENRNERRKKWNLTRMEVMTLASIVEEETSRADEKSRIAGVYLNRLRKKMLLQADPTVKFALGDFAIKRVLNIHLEVESPYNTYKTTGLPPGPICTPSIPSIDAVLNGERHDYYYFVAKTDGSGGHHFSATLSEHNNYAKQYHNLLNQQNIK